MGFVFGLDEDAIGKAKFRKFDSVQTMKYNAFHLLSAHSRAMWS
jgi:hypothetical protein